MYTHTAHILFLLVLFLPHPEKWISGYYYYYFLPVFTGNALTLMLTSDREVMWQNRMNKGPKSTNKWPNFEPITYFPGLPPRLLEKIPEGPPGFKIRKRYPNMSMKGESLPVLLAFTKPWDVQL